MRSRDNKMMQRRNSSEFSGRAAPGNALLLRGMGRIRRTRPGTLERNRRGYLIATAATGLLDEIRSHEEKQWRKDNGIHPLTQARLARVKVRRAVFNHPYPHHYPFTVKHPSPCSPPPLRTRLSARILFHLHSDPEVGLLSSVLRSTR